MASHKNNHNAQQQVDYVFDKLDADGSGLLDVEDIHRRQVDLPDVKGMMLEISLQRARERRRFSDQTALRRRPQNVLPRRSDSMPGRVSQEGWLHSRLLDS